MKKPISLIIIAVALAITGLVIDNQPSKPSAYSICWAAHNEIDGDSEQACGDALEREQSIFMCNKTGDICWTERI